MELIKIKLQMVPLMQEVCQLLNSNNKTSKSAPAAFFISALLDADMLNQIFSILDWATQVLLTYDKEDGSKKLLLHQQVLRDCILAPMNLISVLIAGEFLKHGELRYYLQPNEMTASVAILKLRLFMMTKLVHPMVEFFIEKKAR